MEEKLSRALRRNQQDIFFCKEDSAARKYLRSNSFIFLRCSIVAIAA